MQRHSVKARKKVRVGEVLLQRGLITQTELNQALKEQKQSQDKLGVVLIRQGLVTGSQLQQALYEQTWHNTVATVLLAASTLVPHLPQMVINAPIAAQAVQPTSASSLEDEEDDIPALAAASSNNGRPGRGGAEPETLEGVTPENTATGAPAIAAIPKTALSRNPTVASPLQGFCHPLNGLGWLSQGNGGVTHKGRMQYAYDLAAPIGTPVYAMRSGRVIGAEDRFPDTGGGRDRASKFNYVFIKHDGGYRSIYVHLQQDFRNTINLKAGDWVNAGDLIGYSGNSGWSTGPHLHIEVQKPNKSLRRFSKTVPFAVKGKCSQPVAQS